MIRVVLVHGAWHDSSSWSPVAAALTARGHDVCAVDLPSDRPGLGAREYAEAVLDAVRPSAGERLVLVGHSLGGLTVPVVAERLGAERVAALVLIAALVPRPGSSWIQRLRDEPGIMAEGFGRGVQRRDDGMTWWPVDAAVAGLYAGVAAECSQTEVDAAVAAMRPQAWTVISEVTPLLAWPAVRTVSVVCAGDRVVEPAWSRAAAASIPGIELVELPGWHFPMLTRPAVLADLIHDAAGP